jgi:hypothetical protein
MNVNVYIERLVLDGIRLERGRASQMQAAVKVELTRLLREQGLPSLTAGAVSRLPAGDIALTQTDHPTYIGHQIGRAIFSSLTPGAEHLGTGGPAR